MPINRGMDKQDVVWCIYSVILISHKKEQNGVICRDMDGLRHCYAEWSKSERGKGILFINIYMWNLEKWYGWSYLQNRYTEIREQMYGHQGGKSKLVWIGRLGFIYLHCLYHV